MLLSHQLIYDDVLNSSDLEYAKPFSVAAAGGLFGATNTIRMIVVAKSLATSVEGTPLLTLTIEGSIDQRNWKQLGAFDEINADDATNNRTSIWDPVIATDIPTWWRLRLAGSNGAAMSLKVYLTLRGKARQQEKGGYAGDCGCKGDCAEKVLTRKVEHEFNALARQEADPPTAMVDDCGNFPCSSNDCVDSAICQIDWAICKIEAGAVNGVDTPEKKKAAIKERISFFSAGLAGCCADLKHQRGRWCDAEFCDRLAACVDSPNPKKCYLFAKLFRKICKNAELY